jgi:bacillithiol system protein YtxJ
MVPIVSDADVALLLAERLAVLYKHSPICPTSSMAYEEMLELRRRTRVPVYLVDVVGSRRLSRLLAERVGVTHASPQAIVLRDGVAAWSGSHFEVMAEGLIRALDRVGGGSAEA